MTLFVKKIKDDVIIDVESPRLRVNEALGFIYIGAKVIFFSLIFVAPAVAVVSIHRFYDIELPINHVTRKTVLHLVDVCITSHKHSKQMLKVYRKFSKNI